MLQVPGNRGRHAADQEIQPEKLHEPPVYDAVSGPSFLKRLAQCAEYPVLYAKGPQELLKIERIHPFDAAQNVAVAAFLHQELDGSDDLRAFLNLVKEHQSLPWD